MDHVLKRSLPGTQPRVQIVFPAIVISISLCLMMSVYIHPVQADETNPANAGLRIYGDQMEPTSVSSSSTDCSINSRFWEMKGDPNQNNAVPFDTVLEHLIQQVQDRCDSVYVLIEGQDRSEKTGEPVI